MSVRPRTPSPVASAVAVASATAAVVTAPVRALFSFASASAPLVPRVRVDCLPVLPNFSHRPDTIAYRVEQFDELEQLLRAERERDGILPSETAWLLLEIHSGLWTFDLVEYFDPGYGLTAIEHAISDSTMSSSGPKPLPSVGM